MMREPHICPRDGWRVELDTEHRGPWVCPVCKGLISRSESRLSVSIQGHALRVGLGEVGALADPDRDAC